MEREDNYTKFQKLMSLKDKANIVLFFDRSYSVSSITFLFCQEQYIAIVTYKDTFPRQVEVGLKDSIEHYLRCDFIDPKQILVAYRISPLNGKATVLYDRINQYMSVSEIEEQLKLAPGSLSITE